MLAFDIETTGLCKEKDEVTVVCMYGEVGGEHVEAVFNFKRDGFDAHAGPCRDLLRRADLLCAVNGLRFDVPFLAHFLMVDEDEAFSWLLKLRDPCEVIKKKAAHSFRQSKLFLGC
jgi:uncharacterized protein YprB with RNaseH-like and TPR domain